MNKPRYLSESRWFISLSLVEGVAALAWLLSIPGESGSSSYFTISLGRLAFITPLVVVVVLLAYLAVIFWLRPASAQRWLHRLSAFAWNDLAYYATITIAGALCVLGVNFLGTRTSEPFMHAYLVRLAPYAAFLAILCLQTLLLLRVFRYGWSLDAFSTYRGVFFSSLTALGIVLLLAGIILWTRIGLQPDIVAWGTPGVPLLPSQVWLALALTLASVGAGSLAIHLWKRLRLTNSEQFPSILVNSLICLILWSLAAWRWSAEPLKPSYFAPEPTPPNQEYYPYSDAGNYDLSAQRLIVGAKFEPDVMRPLYSLFLAAAQAASGIGYPSAITWQIALLAFIPVLLYLLAKAIHHPITGILTGLLLIFRESNSLNLTGVLNVSNAKMMLSDLPATLGVILFSLVVVLWLQKPGQRRIYPILAGGILGAFMLIRVQIALLFPAAQLCAFLAMPHRRNLWLKSAAVMLAGILVTLSPWLYRNWQMTGKIYLAGTTNISQAGLLGQRYGQSLEVEASARLPGESEDEYFSRMAEGALKYMLHHPWDAAAFISAHFWHNQVATLLVLPSSFPVLSPQQIPPGGLSNLQTAWSFFRFQCCSPVMNVRDLPYWRSDWQGGFLPASGLHLLASLCLVSIGIGSSWRRSRFVGMLPLFMTVGYSLSNAFVRNSGWRFNLPVDWVGILYYAIGLVQICFWLGTYFKNCFIPFAWEADICAVPAADPEAPFPWKKAVSLWVCFVLLVSAIPLAERFIPARYPPAVVQTALDSLLSDKNAEPLDAPAIQRFLGDEDAVARVGRAMYPRYYTAGDGIPRSGWPSYAVRSYPRLGFVLVGSETAAVVLPQETPPADFANGADVLVLGCKGEDILDARLVMLLKHPMTILLASPSLALECVSP